MKHVAIGFDNHADYSIVLIKNIIDKSECSDFFFHIFVSELTEYEWHDKWLYDNKINRI